MKANFSTIIGDEESNPLDKKEGTESTPVISKFLKYFKPEAKQEEENLGLFGRCYKSALNSCEVEQSYTIFFIVITVGMGLLCLSLFFLPMVVFAPQKFVALFSLGTTIIILSFIFIYGTAEYCKKLFAKDRRAISILFIVSIFVGLWFSFIKNLYFVSLICAVFQLFTLVIFTLSFIPGGQYGISFCWSMVTAPFYSIWNKITGGDSNSSFLPS